MSLSFTIKRTAIKFFDIGFIYTLSLIIGFIAVICIENMFGVFAPKNNPNVIIVAVELIGILWFYGITIYLLNKLIFAIPFPFNQIDGFNHDEFKIELGAWIVEYVILFWYFAHSIQNRIIYIHNKITGSSIPFNLKK